MKKRCLFIVFLILLISLPVSAQWETSVSKDEMEGTEMWFATSPSVSPTQEMDFPYHNIKAWIGIGFDGEDEWVYVGFNESPNVGFNESPNITDTSLQDGYELIETRTKWDDEIKDITLSHDWGSKFIHFRDADAVINNIINSDTVLLELKWFGEGEVYFRFPLKSAASAIVEAREAVDNE